MAKKRRSKRQKRRFHHTIIILVFAFSTLIFLQTHLPHVLNSRSPLQTSVPTTTQQNAQKPAQWYQQTGTQTSALQPESASQASMSPEPIPKGPYPLMPLRKLNHSFSKAHEGTTWSASLARGSENLPLHWVAELLHAPPDNILPPTSSIFTARRKGAWMGCQRSSHLICKGIYRAVKRVNAVTLLVTSCERNTGWLPHVIKKLRGEFRLVRLTCIGERVEGYDHRTKFMKLDVFNESLPEADMIVVYRFVESETLISAMKFFKNVKKSNVKYLASENYPEEENVLSVVKGKRTFRLNGAMPPFWFPSPVYEYENKEENIEDVPMQIVVNEVATLFDEKVTPGIEDLVDPRKRSVRE